MRPCYDRGMDTHGILAEHSLTAGPELDAQIAHCCPALQPGARVVPPISSDRWAAGALLQHLERHGWRFVLDVAAGTCCAAPGLYWGPVTGGATLPLAICGAILAALAMPDPGPALLGRAADPPVPTPGVPMLLPD